jgi:hypothetical protein
MANTFRLIATYTAPTTVGDVQFNSIPQTFQDLKLIISARTQANQDDDGIYVKFNSAATPYYSQVMFDNGSNVFGFRLTTAYAGVVSANTTTAGVFSNSEVYISDYTNPSKHKSAATLTTNEKNDSNIRHDQAQIVWQNNAPITSLFIESAAASILAGSTFYLYGINKS